MYIVILFIQQWTLGGASAFWLLWMLLLWTQLSNISLRPCFQIFRFHTQKWNCNHTVLFNFLRDLMLFSTVGAPFHIPAKVWKGSTLSTASPTLTFCFFIVVILGA